MIRKILFFFLFLSTGNPIAARDDNYVTFGTNQINKKLLIVPVASLMASGVLWMFGNYQGYLIVTNYAAPMVFSYGLLTAAGTAAQRVLF